MIEVCAWRAAIGLHYNRTQKVNISYKYVVYPLIFLSIICSRIIQNFKIAKENFISFIFHYVFIQFSLVSFVVVSFEIFQTYLHFNWLISSNVNNGFVLYFLETCIHSQVAVFACELIILAGDVELNPGPNTVQNSTSCLSIVHTQYSQQN